MKHTRHRFAAWIAGTLVLGWSAGSPASPDSGYRLQSPSGPTPVGITNTWSVDNVVAVSFVAGGSSTSSNDASYPETVPNEPHPGYQPEYRLAFSAFGQHVTGDKPEVYLGEAIPYPAAEATNGWYVNWAAMSNALLHPPGHAFYETSVQQMYVLDGGPITIQWVLTDGHTNRTVSHTYLASSAPAGRPYRIYWTDKDYANDLAFAAPTVNLQGRHVRFHWNTAIPAPVRGPIPTSGGSGTRTNVVRGLYRDTAGHLHAAPGNTATNPLKGLVVMQYFKTADMQEQVPGGVIVVEVREPDVETLPANIGERLLPRQAPHDPNGLEARVSQGLKPPAAVYQHRGQYSHSPKNGWVFATRRTVVTPWEIEIYWEEPDPLGTLWPYEVDWYAADWPVDAALYVRGADGNLGADVLIPQSLGPHLMDFQEPAGHAVLSPAGQFRTTSPGDALVRFQANDNIWFQAIRSVLNTDPMFNRRPRAWTIGMEIAPTVSSAALRFFHAGGVATVTNLPSLPADLTVECWIDARHPDNGDDQAIFARYAVPGTNPAPEYCEFRVSLNAEGRLRAVMGKGNTDGGTPYALELTGPRLYAPDWHHIAFVIDVTNATLYLDGAVAATGAFSTADRQFGAWALRIGRDANVSFLGWMDEIRVWAAARSRDDIQESMHHFLHDYAHQEDLLAYYPVETGDGPLLELRNGYAATLQNVGRGMPATTPMNERTDFSEYAGYIHDPTNRAPCNAALYSYPTIDDPDTETYIFGVNEGLLEVWWARNVQQDGMPDPLHIPGWVQVYTNIWPTDASRIVLASGKGSPPFASAAPPIVYTQNTPGLPGYNPNEEHGLVAQGSGAYVVYALRDDLNTTGASRPFVLVDLTDPQSGRPDMRVFEVVRTNAVYPAFQYEALAGQPLRGPHPLDTFPNLTNTTAVSGPAWEDRTHTWWARGAGAGDTGTAQVVMHNYYPMQDGFAFPALEPDRWPDLHAAIPWLPRGGDPCLPTAGTPVNAAWTIAWPENVPTMDVGQTLTKPANGLPEIWGQLSVDIIYQQSTNNGQGASVLLFDPTVTRGAHLNHELAAYGFKTAPHGNISIRQGRTYFHDLPPDLSERFYYDPTQGTDNLRFIGQRIAPPSGGEFLLVNRLTTAQRNEIKSLCQVTDTSRKQEWDAAINGLATSIVTVPPDTPFDHLAMAAVGSGTGYVTLAFNNASDPALGVGPGDPITLTVIKVEPRLYAGWVIPLKDPVNLLSEQMNMLFSQSFAGRADDFEFQWRAEEPAADGTTPADPGAAPVYDQESGLTRLRIGGEGGSLLDMVNRFFAVRYRVADTNSVVAQVVGTGWSDYTEFNLAEGWVQRVLNAMTPFEQRMRDLYENPVEMQASMLQQAGQPYEGDIALNMQAAEDAGLIQVYHTIFHTAEGLSLDLGINAAAANQQLLLAAGRLNALYMLLGNEAMADALDPTIGFGSDVVIDGAGVLPIDYGAFASSLFCFDNQVPTLLDEELALLRGRGVPELAPGVSHSPYYNRLVWNFTKGIDAGEVAYAVNYNIKGTDAVTIDENTAAERYPQGHGDAWGHYLSALKIYYRLLRNPNFSWGDPSVSPMLLGLRTVDVDYKDEERLAETAEALARTGAQIAERVHCKVSSAADGDTLAGCRDETGDRAWGVGEWTARSGMGAFYNWAVCNSLLPTSGVNHAVEGDLREVDRATVDALPALTAQYLATQRAADNADRGLNPLGLARDTVPFDISPADIDRGKTHFEQIYERAVVALNNASKAFDGAQEASRLLRQQSAAADNFRAAVESQEAALGTSLVEIFGYPYADDIGPSGTYPQGYDGPDLYHFMYVDLEALGFDRRTEIGTLEILEREISASSTDAEATSTVTFHMAENGLLARPPSWTGSRRAEGQIQTAYGEYLVALLEFRAAYREYEMALGHLNSSYDWYHAEDEGWLDLESERVAALKAHLDKEQGQLWGSFAFNTLADLLHHEGDFLKDLFTASGKAFPKSAVFGFSNGGDLTSVLRSIQDSEGATINAIRNWAAWGIRKAMGLFETRLKVQGLDLEEDEADTAFAIAKHNMQSGIKQLAREQQVKAVALMAHLQRIENAQQDFLTLLATGEDLLVERERQRKQTAQRVAAGRYNDMAFRIFRNDALRRYGDAFSLAARYTYLAAMAYDYETCLLANDTRYDPGTRFLDRIVHARTIGRISGGEPVVGSAGFGEPGLADILARMRANWSVLDGRLGFNNPQNETSRFSLRAEFFRIAPGPEGDANWRQALEQCRVADLFTYEPFRRYCLPFASDGGLAEHEPALAIPFNSTINFGQNFFGRELAGGDNTYDSSHFATKIRAVGVWFTGYDRVSDPSHSLHLANQPRVYLVPTGLDVVRTPSDNGESLRAWRVVDQSIPLPYPAAGDDLDAPDWIPLFDSLGGELAKTRRHASLRAYHDQGFDETEMTFNSRLVGRSVWNTQWVLIIPAGTLNSDRDDALDRFINGADGTNGVTDIKLHFKTYSYEGN